LTVSCAPDVFRVSHLMTFDTDEYWTNLTPERALLARVYVEHAKSTENETALACLPVVTALAFQLQATYNEYLELVEEAEESRLLDGDDDEEQDARDAKMEDIAFVIGELLRIGVGLDYTDELGRRKMFAVVRAYRLCTYRIAAS
jgi:condensin complex subunit 3